MGLKKDKIYYTYEDVTIMPNVISSIEHRSECITLDEEGMLPLFTAPMNTVVDINNFELFENEMIHAILPRTERLETRIEYSVRGRWAAYSMAEFESVFCDEMSKLDESNGIKALIDIANGHMEKVFELAKKAKSIWGDKLILMGGNIANPETYEKYVEAGFWGVRCGIGGGSGCITSSNSGIHCPIASLLSEIYCIKKKMIENGAEEKNLTKIIADGGIRNYSDIIKAIGAMGADYVMIGSVFAKMVESAAYKSCTSEEWYHLPATTTVSDLTDMRKTENGWFGKYDNKEIFLGDISAIFYGMASKEGQIALNGEKKKTSEGIKKTLPVLYTMHGWVTNFIDYLRSAMSYTNCYNIKKFNPDNVDSIIISSQAKKAIND